MADASLIPADRPSQVVAPAGDGESTEVSKISGTPDIEPSKGFEQCAATVGREMEIESGEKSEKNDSEKCPVESAESPPTEDSVPAAEIVADNQMPCSSSQQQISDERQKFVRKTIRFRGSDVVIILQDSNGPCPLIALANALLLVGKSEGIAKSSDVSPDDLMNFIANHMLPDGSGKLGTAPTDEKSATNDGNGTEKSVGSLPNASSDREFGLHSTLELLGDMVGGLDVNPKFTAPTAFEFTAQTGVFDVLGIRLVHGWVVEEDSVFADVVRPTSYNSLITQTLAWQDSTEDSTQIKADLAKAFLDQSPQQLTGAGVMQLHHVLKEGEVVVLFRNNHFSTMISHRGQLFVLVTDVGYRRYPCVVWESLAVCGDSLYFDHDFNPSADRVDSLSGQMHSALTLQAQNGEQKSTENDQGGADDVENVDKIVEVLEKPGDLAGHDDEHVAKHFQQEEDFKLALAMQRQYDAERRASAQQEAPAPNTTGSQAPQSDATAPRQQQQTPVAPAAPQEKHSSCSIC